MMNRTLIVCLLGLAMAAPMAGASCHMCFLTEKVPCLDGAPCLDGMAFYHPEHGYLEPLAAEGSQADPEPLAVEMAPTGEPSKQSSFASLTALFGLAAVGLLARRR